MDLRTLVYTDHCLLCSYAAAGLQAVLELYFVTFLYICLRKDRASSLATTTVNVYIAIYQLCALSGGFLADKVIGKVEVECMYVHRYIFVHVYVASCIPPLHAVCSAICPKQAFTFYTTSGDKLSLITLHFTGNFLTQNISNIITTVGICLMTFASWQYALEEPSCCCDHGNSYVDPTDPTSHLLGDTHCTSNCSELHKYTLLESPRLHISPGLNMFLAIAGLVVSPPLLLAYNSATCN